MATSIDGEPHGIIWYKDSSGYFQLVLVELTKGKLVHQYDIPRPRDKDVKVRLADGCSNFFVAVMKATVFIVDKSSSNFISHYNSTPINVIACHPEEEMFAVGEVTGSIKLWRNIFDKTPVKAELHWHHMIVLSLAFSQSGTILYSGGNETVLVKWQIKEKQITKDFLPRMSGSIMQISVDPRHDKISVSTDDNAMLILNASFARLKSIQDFTRASPYDLGLSDPFPAGIRINPRNRHLVLNGRIGHLQFFSTKNMKMLFNVDISMRNVTPRLKKQNIFSTQVTHAAFSMKWMATAESWNDLVHAPDSRLKFWKFLEDKQTYSLHTQIEQPHVKEIIAIEFSSQQKVKELICATAGLDCCIKIWSLEKAEEVRGAKMIWLCIDQLSYKNLPVRSLGFSQDSSLIGAGFGNILCVWDSQTFKLKCALSAPAALDGSTNRILIALPEKESRTPKKSQKILTTALEKRRKILELMKSVIDSKASDSIVKNITQDKARYFTQKSVKTVKPKNLSKAEKHEIFKRVLAQPDLSFNQKIQTLHKLHIYYKISSRVEQDVTSVIARMSYENIQLYKNLHRKLNMVKSHDKHKLEWRFRTWNMLTSKRNRRIVTVRKLLTHKIDEQLVEKKKAKEVESEQLLPIKNLAHITNVVFCVEESSHLVIVTTPDRLLIWNLLTLKLQGSFKVHTKFITLDPLTNLVAVFTKFNELFIVHPTPALTIHHQKNLPDIYGAIWVPRENPRIQSVTVNWQAKSQLLFLTENQEICCLKLPGEEDYGNIAPFMDFTNGFTANTPFAAMIAQKITDETTRDDRGMTKRIAVGGSGAIKDVSYAVYVTIFIIKQISSSLSLRTHKTDIDKMGKLFCRVLDGEDYE